MNIEGYQLRTQLGAGPDGIAYQATRRPDGGMTVAVLDLARGRGDEPRWRRLVPRLRLAAQLAHPSAIRILQLALDPAAPYAVLEWPGETTLATATKSELQSVAISAATGTRTVTIARLRRSPRPIALGSPTDGWPRNTYSWPKTAA